MQNGKNGTVSLTVATSLNFSLILLYLEEAIELSTQ
jgi:hypothetical protein